MANLLIDEYLMRSLSYTYLSFLFSDSAKYSYTSFYPIIFYTFLFIFPILFSNSQVYLTFLFFISEDGESYKNKIVKIKMRKEVVSKQ